MAREHLLQAFLEQQLQSGLHAKEQVLRRRAAELVVAVGRLAALQVPVKARAAVLRDPVARALVEGDEPQTRRGHQSLLRGPYGHVGAQLVHRERGGGEGGDHIDHKKRRMAGGIDRGLHCAQVVGRTACGVGVHRKYGRDFALGVGAQGGLHVVRVGRVAFPERCANSAAPEPLRLHRPGFREVPGARDQYRPARRDQVLHRGFPGAMAVGREHEYVRRLGLQHLLQADFDRVDRFPQAGVAVVQRLAVHGVEHFGRHVRGAGGVQEADTGDAFHGHWLAAIWLEIGSRRGVGRQSGSNWLRCLTQR